MCDHPFPSYNAFPATTLDQHVTLTFDLEGLLLVRHHVINYYTKFEKPRHIRC